LQFVFYPFSCSFIFRKMTDFFHQTVIRIYFRCLCDLFTSS